MSTTVPKDVLATVYCRCCGDEAASPGDARVWADLEGTLCRACYHELHRGSLHLALRDIRRAEGRKRSRMRRR